jgi:hypothetical protein
MVGLLSDELLLVNEKSDLTDSDGGRCETGLKITQAGKVRIEYEVSVMRSEGDVMWIRSNFSVGCCLMA